MKKVLRTLTLALLALFASSTVRAADHVKVSEKDGKTTIFALSDDPTVTCRATDLVITAGTKTVNFPLTEGLTFEIITEPTAIQTAPNASRDVRFTLDNSVKGEGLQPGSTVAIYRIDGQTVGTATVNSNGSVEIPLNGLRGIFIVKSSTKSFKFIKK